jgi:hypothetical protein
LIHTGYISGEKGALRGSRTQKAELTMRIYAYLRVLSDETTIRSLHSETNVPNATTKPTKARRGEVDEDVWWNWQTRQVSIEADNIDGKLRELLLSHRTIFPMIKRVSILVPTFIWKS